MNDLITVFMIPLVGSWLLFWVLDLLGDLFLTVVSWVIQRAKEL
jgi:hypothetical protein